MTPEQEKWVPVVGWEGLYEVSDHGRVRSLDRMVTTSGTRPYTYFKAGRMLRLSPVTRNHYPTVPLSRDGVTVTTYVHRLVLEAFVGPCPEGMRCCHWDDVGSNNHLSNLRWDTQVNNGLDMTRNGNNHHANKFQCINGHRFTAENTRLYGNGWRRCRQCVRDEYHRRKDKHNEIQSA